MEVLPELQISGSSMPFEIQPNTSTDFLFSLNLFLTDCNSSNNYALFLHNFQRITSFTIIIPYFCAYFYIVWLGYRLLMTYD